MKLNDHTNALRFLNPADPLVFSTAKKRREIPQVAHFIDREFPALRPSFNQRKQLISSPFLRAYERSQSKLAEVIGKQPICQSGTFILPTDPGHNNTIFYDLFVGAAVNGEMRVDGSIIGFSKAKEMAEPYLFALWHASPNASYTYSTPTSEDYTMTAEDWFTFVYRMLLFLRYCKLETKTIAAGARGSHGQEKYVNETKSDVEILDSTWFTTTIRTEGFWVGADEGGFLRWQRVGPGRSVEKLIWVEAFEKESYSRQAKMLRDDPEAGKSNRLVDPTH